MPISKDSLGTVLESISSCKRCGIGHCPVVSTRHTGLLYLCIYSPEIIDTRLSRFTFTGFNNKLDLMLQNSTGYKLKDLPVIPVVSCHTRGRNWFQMERACRSNFSAMIDSLPVCSVVLHFDTIEHLFDLSRYKQNGSFWCIRDYEGRYHINTCKIQHLKSTASKFTTLDAFACVSKALRLVMEDLANRTFPGSFRSCVYTGASELSILYLIKRRVIFEEAYLAKLKNTKTRTGQKTQIKGDRTYLD